MALYVHTSTDCKRDAQKHDQDRLLANLSESVQSSQNLTGFDTLLPSPFVKKALGRNFRLIGVRKPISNDIVVLFLRILSRGSREYENFLKAWENQTEALLNKYQPNLHETIKSVHDHCTRHSSVPEIAPPSTVESKWLYNVRQPPTLADDLVVMETENWVQAMKAPENTPYLTSFHGILKNLIDDIDTGSNHSHNIRTLWDSEQERGIIYVRAHDPSILLLLEAIKRGDEIESTIKKYKQQIDNLNRQKSTLARMAIRSYLLLMVLDQTAWIEIQQDQAANLALSPEETRLLQNIRSPHLNVGFPLFINGRAGSGKSTMLQYLVADYVNFALREKLQDGPLYMTCSEDLLRRARQVVTKRLKVDQNILYEQVKHSDDDISAILDRSFQVFHKFLYSLIPVDHQGNLPLDRYVDYRTFQLLWREKFQRHRKGGPIDIDISWHVIRSYIKGIWSTKDDDLTPEEFDALPRRRRSVSSKSYRDVYTHVWEKWYKPLCEDEGYWDDQDIAALILELGITRDCNYAAIFCDEAQDFTSSELEIIYQMSLFSRRSLRPTDLRNVPFIFAGDPLQTINPSGFRWSAVKASFHDRFVATLNTAQEQQYLQINLEQFQFNYRSNPGVVRFCNLIQLLRAALAQDGDNTPQKPWWVDQQVSPVWFDADDDQTAEELERNPSFVKLVYCETDEETEYVEHDAVLQEALTADGGIYRNVLGPTRAKGLEFSIVVLYRFGQRAPSLLKKWIEGRVELPEAEDRLSLEYFLNRLYVAASRAKNRIIIVDSADALDSFWKFATNSEVWEHLIDQTQDHEDWRDQIAGILPGKESDWTGESINQEQQAREYASRARAERDPYLMRQAGLAFRGINRRDRATECFAEAFTFEREFTEAGKLYQEICKFDSAFDCFWKSGRWAQVKSLATVAPSVNARLECRASDFMLGAGPPDPKFLDQLMSAADEGEEWKSRICGDQTWHRVLAEIVERLAACIDSDSDFLWSQLFRVFDEFRSRGIRIADSSLGHLAFASGTFDRVVELWHGLEESRSSRYHLAMGRTSEFPECIEHLGRAGRSNEVIDTWREQGLDRVAIERIDPRIVLIVVDSALERQVLDLACQLLDVQPEVDRSVKLLSQMLRTGRDVKDVEVAVGIIAKGFVREGRWTEAVSFFRHRKFPRIGTEELDRHRLELEDVRFSRVILDGIVSVLAVSDACADVQVVQDFLSETFVPKDRHTRSGRPKQGYQIAPNIVGAAIERAGRVVDALRYYERLESASDSNVRRFAKTRLVRCLERHAAIVRDVERSKIQAGRACKIRVELGIGDKVVPEFPIIDSRQSQSRVQREDTASIANGDDLSPLGDFEFVRSKKRDKLRVEHRHLFETVTIDANRFELVSGDVNPKVIETRGEEVTVWCIESWQSSMVRMTKREDNVLVRFDCRGRQRKITLFTTQ